METTCLSARKKNITDQVKQLFYEYFKFKITDQDKPYAPHVVCSSCVSTLQNWKKSKGKTQFKFAVPTYWMQVNDHSQCYFCQTKIQGVKKTNFKKIKYPNVKSAKRPQPWNEGEEKPVPIASDSSAASTPPREDEMNTSVHMPDIPDGPMPYDQAALNDLVRNCNLSKETAELLAQSLSDRKLLTPDCKITFFRDRHVSYAEFFKEEDDVTFCSDVE